ncbi:TfoX/Sxy family protein [Arsenicicoccus bolidensis]|uniref:TfoX/Sxy family protein n=1 Tax=Arsenicicoccus bolidensis TaxID=229480 RepID=A0ABS9Q6D4_9MICO|nr:TfoX/Sxy family protein [Arsenicicoccus bolidensis]MCG7323437.1 TfoX/Sxy family protein [Arsenicicoccus bolidensis]
MAYDENLAARIRAYVQDDLDVTEKQMFGGLAFLASGNMAVAAVSAGGLMLRCDPEEADRLVAEDGASRMVMKGREMQNWLVVDERTLATNEGLRTWLEVGLDFARSLPAK